MRVLLLMAIFSGACSESLALPFGVLPDGVGIVQLGYRKYQPTTEAFSPSGAKVSLGQRNSQDLTGPNLQAGDGGALLQQLANTIDKEDPSSGTSNALVNHLNLGTAGVNARAVITAYTLGAAFGAAPNWTVYFGIPIITAHIDAELTYDGSNNNAAQLKQQLGNYAFGQLQAGLNQAAAISLSDIQASFNSHNYNPLGPWSKTGLGDLQIGVRHDLDHLVADGLEEHLLLIPHLSLATGYMASPDTVQSVSFGSGYNSLGIDTLPQLIYHRDWRVGLPNSLQYNLPAAVPVRVPQGNSLLVDKNFDATATIRPGLDNDMGFLVGGGYGNFSAEVIHGMKRHFSDRYSGPIPGNYDLLGADTDKVQYYRLTTLKVDTTRAYLKGEAKVPFIASLSAFQTLAGRNCNNDQYYELSLTGFFTTKER